MSTVTRKDLARIWLVGTLVYQFTDFLLACFVLGLML